MPRNTRSTKKEGAAPRPGTDWQLVGEVLASPLVRTVYLHGPPGLGKTWAAFHMGRVERGFRSVTLTEETTSAELRGIWVPQGEELVWQDGPFTEAMRLGIRLVVNEIGHASADCLSFLHPVLESAETARFTLPTRETVTPAEGYTLVATDNLPPEELPEALRDRFDCVLEIREPHPEAMRALSPRLRHAAERSFALEEDRRLGLRRWLSLQRLEPELGLERACAAVFGAARGAQIHDAVLLAGEAVPVGGGLFPEGGRP